MIALLCLLCYLPDGPLLRVYFDVEIAVGDKHLTAILVLNQLDANQFSLHCRKTPAGTLFTYWATSDFDTLYLPRESVAYVGNAGGAFALFPEGPELARDGWLDVLLADEARSLGNFDLRIEDGWRKLFDPEAKFSIRWREKSRGQKSKFSDRVLKPRLDPGTRLQSLQAARTDFDDSDLR